MVMAARVPQRRRNRQRGRVAFGQARGGDGREGVVLLETHDRRQARTRGGQEPTYAPISVRQRFDGAARLNLHGHVPLPGWLPGLGVVTPFFQPWTMVGLSHTSVFIRNLGLSVRRLAADGRVRSNGSSGTSNFGLKHWISWRFAGHRGCSSRRKTSRHRGISTTNRWPRTGRRSKRQTSEVGQVRGGNRALGRKPLWFWRNIRSWRGWRGGIYG
jgi:hypothetical protein